MKTILSDGRIFETQEILQILFDDSKPVYKYEFDTVDRHIVSSARHEWAVWDKKQKDVILIDMESLDINTHELLIQGWDNER